MQNEADGSGADNAEELLNSSQIDAWPEAVDGKALLDELRDYYGRFTVLPRWGAVTVALWTVHTYAFDLRRVSTYLGIESPEKECGKSTLMALMSKLVNRPEVASNISSPAFFRVIDELRPTLLIDEADTLLPGNAELRGILNAGYTRELAYVLRVTSERVERQSVGASERDRGGSGPPPRSYGGTRLARFSCWGPKAIAQIGHLPDTLRSRCIVIRMQKKMAQEQCERFQEDKPLLTRLRGQCARFVMDQAEAIANAQPGLPGSLSDRAAQIWEPLVILADVAGGDWPALAREAARGLSAGAEANSPIGMLLFDLWFLFANLGGGRMFSRVLVHGLNNLPDRPWAEKRQGKGITDAWLAEQLQPYGVRSRTLRIGEIQAKGYLEEDFQEAFQRYMSRADMEALKAKLNAERRFEVDPPSSDSGAASGWLASRMRG